MGGFNEEIASPRAAQSHSLFCFAIIIITTTTPRPQIINRRRLEPGPDMQPITYYIDPTVPPEWRDAFKAGVEAWQPAFKAAGLGDKAIRAVLPGEEDWPEDYQVCMFAWKIFNGDWRWLNWVFVLGCWWMMFGVHVHIHAHVNIHPSPHAPVPPHLLSSTTVNQ